MQIYGIIEVSLKDLIILVTKDGHPNKGQIGDIVECEDDKLVVRMADGNYIKVPFNDLDESIGIYYRSRDMTCQDPSMGFDEFIKAFCRVNGYNGEDLETMKRLFGEGLSRRDYAFPN